jgi:GNAT superfamily N-acetyltransferase
MLVIRRPLPHDEAPWRRLWEGYCRFYETELPEAVTDRLWGKLLFPDSDISGFVAEVDGQVIGLVHYLFHASTWTTTSYCYLEDLYVAADGRGTGVGRALIAAVEAEARERGCARLYWLTDAANARAQALYDQVATRTGFVVYRKPLP